MHAGGTSLPFSLKKILRRNILFNVRIDKLVVIAVLFTVDCTQKSLR